MRLPLLLTSSFAAATLFASSRWLTALLRRRIHLISLLVVAVLALITLAGVCSATRRLIIRHHHLALLHGLRDLRC